MPTTTLDWTNVSANGDYTLGTGTQTIDVSIATNTNGAGQSGSVQTLGTPAAEGLWVDDLTDAVTTTLTFEKPVEKLSFEIFDLDQNGTDWDERITILATDAEGNVYPVDYADLAGTHSASGGTIDASGTNDAGTDAAGAADSVSVSIDGPIVSLEIIFEPGESADETGTIGLSDIALDIAPDGIVEGTSAGELIDGAFVDDPEGDVITDGNNVIEAGDGNDTISLGEGDDSVDAGAGADSAEMGRGNDTFVGGAGDDYVNGDYGNDVLHGGTGDDFLRGSFGNDTIHSGGIGDGDDYLWGGFGDDTFVITDGFGNDTISAENQDEVNGDTLDLNAVTTDLTIDLTSSDPGAGSFTDGTDTTTFEAIEHIELSAGQDTLVLADGSGADRVIGFTLPTDNGDGTFSSGDMLDVTGLTYDFGARGITTRDIAITEDSDGNAVLGFPGGESLTLVGVTTAQVSDPDVLEAMGVPEAPDGYVTGTETADTFLVGDMDGDGDVIDGGDAALAGASGDDDHVRTLGGDDLVHAGAGNDIIEGGEGDDTLFGDAGDDTLIGGAGADDLYGGDDDDTFTGITAGDHIFGDAGSDTLNLSGVGAHNIVVDGEDPNSGTIEFLDGDGLVTGTATYKDIETIVPCFTPGTQITTNKGFVPVEDLAVGDLVCTRDHGLQPIRWVGKRILSAEELADRPYLKGVRIEKDALGQNLPDRDMVVSPNHRVLVNDPSLELLLGEREVLVAAKHLLDMTGISREAEGAITYIHFMFDRHEIVLSDQLWSESFQPGNQALSGLDEAQRNEIFDLFPELKEAPEAVFGTARRVALKHEAKLIRK